MERDSDRIPVVMGLGHQTRNNAGSNLCTIKVLFPSFCLRSEAGELLAPATINGRMQNSRANVPSCLRALQGRKSSREQVGILAGSKEKWPDFMTAAAQRLHGNGWE
jgi:hypothetical protein